MEQVATSGRVVDVLIGPAGTGKSTTLAGLRAVWEAEHGPGSVKGLAPSASAAANLAAELGIATENTAKWLAEADREPSRMAQAQQLRALAERLPAGLSGAVGERVAELEAEIKRWQLKTGDLVLVDEASLAGTFALDRLTAQARQAGAKVLLVGDFAQLGAVGAGGAFSMLVEDREVPAELSEVHRFHQPWEKRASTELRAGSVSAIDAYLRHGRVTGGDRDEMLAACYRGWKTDVDAGRSSLMIAQDLATVTELNRLARADRVATGQVAGDGLALSDGLVGGVGDVVVTRQNDRALRLSDGEWVRNRDRFVVVSTHQDGAMTVRRLDGDGHVVLPPAYVAAHVELGYATSAHAAQGQTVGTAHALVSPAMTREVLYVAATRARESNRLYVDVEPQPAGEEMAHGPGEALDARDVLVTIASRKGAERSAHQARAGARERATSFEQLVREHQSLVAADSAPRWEAVLQRSGLPADVLAQLRRSGEWDELLGTMRTAAEVGVDVGAVAARLVTAEPTEPGEDRAARLRRALQRSAQAIGRGRGSRKTWWPGSSPAPASSTTKALSTPCANARTPLPGALGTWPRRPSARAPPGASPSGRHRSGPWWRKRGGTASASSPPTATAGASPPGAPSGTWPTSVRSPKLPTEPGLRRRPRRQLGWAVFCRKCPRRGTPARAFGPR